MDDVYQIALVEQPADAAHLAIGQGLDRYNVEQAGDAGFQRMCFAVYGPGQEVVGGVVGEVFWGWLFIELLWVRDELRGRGYGHRLLEAVEEEACKRGARHAYLDTFSFQAPDFYKRHGYRVFGELPDFPPGHHRFFFTKELDERPEAAK